MNSLNDILQIKNDILLTTIIYNKAFFKQLDYGICSPIFETMESSAIAFLVFDLA